MSDFKNKCAISTTCKCKGWECLLYPDSMNPHYKEILSYSGYDAQISPLHDKDLKPDGSYKKPHYHVIMVYPSAVTWARAKEDMLNLGAIYEPDPRVISEKKINSVRAYHLHKTPQAIADGKYQYNINDVQFFSKTWFKGEYEKVIEDVLDSSIDSIELLSQIMEWCENNFVVSYFDLFNYCKNNNKQWLKFIVKGGYSRTIIELLKSMNFTLQRQLQLEEDRQKYLQKKALTDKNRNILEDITIPVEKE